VAVLDLEDVGGEEWQREAIVESGASIGESKHGAVM
jgi:hypothetical protein